MTTPAPDPPRVDDAERMVALTDLAVGIECLAVAAIVARDDGAVGEGIRGPMLALLLATASASLAGAALHGLTADRADPGRRVLWRWSLASIGVSGIASWWLAARVATRPTTARVIERTATVAHAPYLAAAVSGDRPFTLAIASYVPGAVFLGGALASRLGDRRDRAGALAGLGGLAVTFAAAGIQVRRIGLTRWFDHNALFHTLQAVGIALLFAAGRGLRARR